MGLQRNSGCHVGLVRRIIFPAMATHAPAPHRPPLLVWLNLGMGGLLIAWLAVASYALAYLISH